MHPRLADIQYKSFLKASNADWDELIVDLKSLMKVAIPSELQEYWNELDSSEPDVRKKALDTLKDWEDPEATEVLAKAIEQKKLRDVREGAALRLARRTNGADERAIQGFDRFVLCSRFEPEALFALQIIGGFNSRKAGMLIRQAILQNDNPEMRRLAVEIVGKQKIDSLADVLLRCLTEERDLNVRLQAAKSLRELEDTRTVEKIVELISPWVSERADTTAGFLGAFVTVLIEFGDNGIGAAVDLLHPNAPIDSNDDVINALKKAKKEIVIGYVKKRLATASTPREQGFWKDSVLRAFGEWVP
jgi:hypothetical protein